MEEQVFLFAYIICGLFFLLLITVLVRSLKAYFSTLKYLKMEMLRAEVQEDYDFWREELSAFRPSIIPGLTPDRVKKIKKLFYRGRYAKKKDSSDRFTGLMLPFLLSIFATSVCLAGSTYAWFTASQNTSASPIQAASYSVDIKISTLSETEESAELILQDGVYSLKKDVNYSVSLTAVGDASTGYCTLDFGSFEAYTVQFPDKERGITRISFTLTVSEDTDVKIIPQWGTCVKENKIDNGDNYSI